MELIRRQQHFELLIRNSLRNVPTVLKLGHLISYLSRSHCPNPAEPTGTFLPPQKEVPIIPKTRCRSRCLQGHLNQCCMSSPLKKFCLSGRWFCMIGYSASQANGLSSSVLCPRSLYRYPHLENHLMRIVTEVVARDHLLSCSCQQGGLTVWFF